MIRIPALAFSTALALAACVSATAQPPQYAAQTAAPIPSYARVAQLVLDAPLVIDVTVKSASRIKPADAPGLDAGRARFFVEANVNALIRGTSAIPTQLAFLADVPLDARGKPPKLKKVRLVLFARPIQGHPGQIQLTGIDSQFAWSAPLDSRVRGIVKEVVATDAPPAITGVGNAFHVPGAIAGEGETQIFLMTADSAPVSLQILHRPGERARWSVSTGEFVDDSAGAPPKDTLLWYRLACGLPRELPASSLENEDPANARVARADYQLVLRELGPCA